MLHVSVNLMCMQLQRLHKLPTYAHPMFTKAFEMRYPVFKEVCSPYAQLLHCNIHYTYHLLLSELFAPLIVLHVRSNLSLMLKHAKS